MGFAEDVEKLLATPPNGTGPPISDVAREEARRRVKSADATFAQDPRGPGVATALEAYREALELDAACKPAYEGIAKIVLARAADAKPALESLARWVAVGRARLPADSDLAALERRVKDLLPTEEKSARPTRPSQRLLQKAAPTKNCKYCGSPIPADARACRSCQLSGELRVPTIDEGTGSKKPIIIIVVVMVLAAAGAVAWHLLANR